MELAFLGSGEIMGVNADVCNEKKNLYTNRKYYKYAMQQIVDTFYN